MTNKDKNRIVGIVVTTVFHAVALVLLLTLCFTTPLPLPGEAGVEVDMGMYAHVNETSYQQVEETSVKEVVEETDEIEEDILSEDEDVLSYWYTFCGAIMQYVIKLRSSHSTMHIS